MNSLSTPVSWTALKKNTDIGSVHTISDYVQTLSEMFVLSVFYRYDSAANRPKFDGSKKIYFSDSFFMHALNGHIRQQSPYDLSMDLLDDPGHKGRLVEQVVANHCIDAAFNLASKKIGFEYRSSVFYWRSKKPREVDFVMRHGDSVAPIEVKYQNQVRADDLSGLADFRKATGISHGVVLTKDQLQTRNGRVLIPASLFLLLV